MHQVAPQFAADIIFLRRFDALGHDETAQQMRHAHDVLKEDAFLGVRTYGRDDEAVEFYDGGFDMIEKLKIRVARPEVVERQVSKSRSQFEKRGQRIGRIAKVVTL